MLISAGLNDGATNDGAKALIQRREVVVEERVRKTERREEISGRRIRRRRRRFRRRRGKERRKRRKIRKVEGRKESSNFSRIKPEVDESEWRRICTTIE